MIESPELRQLVLDACHGLAACGLGGYIGGHVSVRVPGERLYWTNVLDRAFEEMTLDDMLLVNFEGQLVHGDRPISPGIDFHQGIYMLRADVNAIVHTHAFWNTAQSSFGRPPKMWHNLSTYFRNRVAISPDDTVAAIGPVLKSNIAIVMPWHGAITIGKTIGDAAALHKTFEYVCQLDVTLAVSDSKPMPDDACERMQVLLGKANYLELTWELMRRKGIAASAGRSSPAVS
jgi:ribulose-5-phosphate 4-epimerase/fuculose-1-phosphate aldolase